MTSPITYRNCLVCIFSFNMTTELKILIRSIRKYCADFDFMIIDDASDNNETIKIIESNGDLFKRIVTGKPREKIRTRGRLFENIQYAYDFAIANDYKYLFMVQDDMQFLRSFDEKILAEYSKIFAANPQVIQVDPRFLRRLGTIEIDNELGAYTFRSDDDRRSYADVGILHLERLVSLGWKFAKGERLCKEKAHAMGLRRIFPFTPIMMHMPYPKIFRKGKEIRRFPWPLVRRGECYYLDLSQEEIARLDSRSIDSIPYARDVLKAKNLLLSGLHYRYGDENRVFS